MRTISNIFYGLTALTMVDVYTLVMSVVCGFVLYWKHLIVITVLTLGAIGAYGIISGGHEFAY